MSDQQQNNQNQTETDHLTNEAEAFSNKNAGSDAVYLNNSSLQTGADFKQDKNSDHIKRDKSLVSSGVDDLRSNSGDVAGTERAGTAERKTYGDLELNKGLEAQAKDEES